MKKFNGTDKHLRGSEMANLITRIMILIPPTDEPGGAVLNFDPLCDISFEFDKQTEAGDPPPGGDPGDGDKGEEKKVRGNGEPGDGDGDGHGDGADKPGRGDSIGDRLAQLDHNSCRCGTCGR
jgi:hypothetical protein